MISRFENTSADNSLPGMPVRLLSGESERKKVSRLEFPVMDRPGAELAKEDPGPVWAAGEVRLEEKIAALERQLESQQQQIAVRVEEAEREARMKSREEWEGELEERVSTERARLMRICEEFGKERTRYFADVEAEVVKLALAIAARVLHREAKLDPLLLMAVVRVALEKVADNSTTVLRVPAAEVDRWREGFMEGAKSEVQLEGDERLGVGECVLETNVGRVELGVSAQLEEIEKGFFDLLQQRPE